MYAGKSKKGGWNHAQLRCLGVKIPLRHGWYNRLVGTTIRSRDADEFLRLKDAHCERKPRDTRRDDMLGGHSGIAIRETHPPPMRPCEPMPWKAQYQHPNWQRYRLEILKRDGFRCRVCNNADSTLHVHHRTYVADKFIWDVPPDDLVTLCDACHALFHDKACAP